MAKKHDGLTLNVSYGNVSFGEDTAAVGVGISRGQFESLADADALLTKGQLKARLTGSAPMFEKPIDAVVTTGTLKVDTESIGVRFSFAISSIDRGDVSWLSKSTGTATLERIGDAGADSGSSSDGGDDDDDLPLLSEGGDQAPPPQPGPAAKKDAKKKGGSRSAAH